MRIGNRLFAPRLWACLLYGAVFVAMLGLGNWQLNRAALKVSMQSAAENAMMAEAMPLSEIDDLEAASSMFNRVLVTGIYDPERQFLWDNRIHEGRAGFEVISTVMLNDGTVALVNRGWIAPGSDRQTLPDVSLPANILGRSVTLEGFLSKPSKGFASGNAITGERRWPRLLQYFDYNAIGELLGEPVIATVVQTQVMATNALKPTSSNSRPEWLQANWQPAASGPAKHYSYAFQWFAMAFALTVIFLVVNTSKIQQRA